MLAHRWRTKLRILTVILALTALVTYGYFQANDLIMGPVVKIEYPKNNQLIEDRTFTLYGKTRNITKVSLNGTPIFINTEGEFREKLPMMGPRNIIEVEAKDRFGRSVKIQQQVLGASDTFVVPSQEEIERIRSGEEDTEEEEEDTDQTETF